MTDDVERDPIVAELRSGLARRAEQAPRGEFLAERIIAAADQAAAGDRARGPVRRWTLPLVAALAVAAVVGAVVGIAAIKPAHHHSTPLASRATTPVATRPAPTPVPTPTSAAIAGPAATDLQDVRIDDVTFAYKQGWALAAARCLADPARRCTAVLHTGDDRRWPALATTQVGFNVPGVSGGCTEPCVRNLRFVNDRTGYAFGPNALFLTTDGGHVWTRQGRLGADALESLNGDVLRVTRGPAGVVVSRSAIGGSSWHPVSLHAAADAVALNRGNDADYLLLARSAAASTLYRSRDTGRTWTALGEPCPAGRAATVAAGAGGGVSVLCAEADGVTKYVATSTDFGRRFTIGDPVPTSASLLAGDPSTVLLAGGQGLSRSTDGGRGWTQIAGLTGTLGFVGFESTTQATAVSADGRTIWTTVDGGRSWQAVPL